MLSNKILIIFFGVLAFIVLGLLVTIIVFVSSEDMLFQDSSDYQKSLSLEKKNTSNRVIMPIPKAFHQTWKAIELYG